MPKISYEERLQLEKKELLVIPIELFLEMAKSCSKSELMIETLIWHETGKASHRFKENRPALIPRSRLEEKCDIARSSVQKAIRSLRAKGRIGSERTFDSKTGAPLSCLFDLTLPKELKDKILRLPDRNSRKGTQKKKEFAEEKEEHISLNKPPQQVKEEMPKIISLYNEKVGVYITQGLKRYKANSKAINEFSELERKTIIEYFDSKKKIYSYGLEVTQTQGNKVATIKQYNKQHVNVNSESRSKKIQSCNTQPKARFIVNDLQKKQLESKANSRLLEMDKQNAIPRQVLKDGKKLDDLVDELVFHAIHCTSMKINSVSHALNGALTLVREGRWSTPKILQCERYKGSLQLEARAMADKLKYQMSA